MIAAFVKLARAWTVVFDGTEHVHSSSRRGVDLAVAGLRMTRRVGLRRRLVDSSPFDLFGIDSSPFDVSRVDVSERRGGRRRTSRRRKGDSGRGVVHARLRRSVRFAVRVDLVEESSVFQQELAPDRDVELDGEHSGHLGSEEGEHDQRQR